MKFPFRTAQPLALFERAYELFTPSTVNVVHHVDGGLGSTGVNLVHTDEGCFVIKSGKVCALVVRECPLASPSSIPLFCLDGFSRDFLRASVSSLGHYCAAHSAAGEREARPHTDGASSCAVHQRHDALPTLCQIRKLAYYGVHSRTFTQLMRHKTDAALQTSTKSLTVYHSWAPRQLFCSIGCDHFGTDCSETFGAE